ncbi:MAG: MFS transporter [Candidatus Eiseniibacteriota bacterium]
MHSWNAGRRPTDAERESRRQGLRENLGQFSLLLLINAFVGVMVGMERSILPLLAEREFGIVSRAAILSFLITFGLVKALANAFAGGAADRWGRRRTLIAGWIAGIPVPLLIIFAPSWGWVVAANVLLGVNQGLCWSAAIIMKVDLVGPRRRGLAIGLNESSGYLAVSAAALATGYLAARHGLRPEPFLLGLGAALAGLACSWFARETRGHLALESPRGAHAHATPGPAAIFRRVSWAHAPLRAVSQAGLVNNLNDGVSWGLFPLLFAARGLSLERTALLVAIYPAVWGIAQLFTGALSDRMGRRALMSAGMVLQGMALIAVAGGRSWGPWLAAMIALGLGTALVYPTFLSAVSDHCGPAWRATAIGVSRWWRDLGYVVGAVLAGAAADRIGIPASVQWVGVITIASGLIVAATYRDAAAPETDTRVEAVPPPARVVGA